jgi:hypothetical protein
MNKTSVTAVILLSIFLSSCVYIGLMNFGVGQAAFKDYEFDGYTKKDLLLAINLFEAQNAQFNVPERYEDLLVLEYGSPDTEIRNRWNADSVNFYYALPREYDTLIVHTRFRGLMDDWNDPYMTNGVPNGVIAFYSYRVGNSNWKRKGGKEVKRTDVNFIKEFLKNTLIPEIRENLPDQ